MIVAELLAGFAPDPDISFAENIFAYVTAVHYL
jgi:hypothetical protein